MPNTSPFFYHEDDDDSSTSNDRYASYPDSVEKDIPLPGGGRAKTTGSRIMSYNTDGQVTSRQPERFQ